MPCVPVNKPGAVISIIAAMADNRVIGRDNRLPWHLPADLAHFKMTTLDRPIIMGRRTFESLPGLLPRRRHIVVTRNRRYNAPGCTLADSPEAAIEAAGAASEIFFIGGASLYRAAIPMARRMHLSLVHGSFDGDVLFPDWNPAQWIEVSRSEHPSDDRNAFDLTFVVLERVAGLEAISDRKKESHY